VFKFGSVVVFNLIKKQKRSQNSLKTTKVSKLNLVAEQIEPEARWSTE